LPTAQSQTKNAKELPSLRTKTPQKRQTNQWTKVGQPITSSLAKARQKW